METDTKDEEVFELKQVQVRLRLADAEPLYSTEPIDTPDRAADVMADVLSQMDREYCCVVNLDNRMHPVNFNIVSIGSLSNAQVSMQNVFKSAILSNAAGIMMLHNHPSGDLSPSTNDIVLTKKLIEAGRIMDIPVLDHIIVAGGTGRRYSFFEDRREMFNVPHDEKRSLGVSEVNAAPAGDVRKYRMFYAPYQKQEMEAFQKETGWHQIFGSDEQALNGDTWIVFREVSDLPKYLRDYAKRQLAMSQRQNNPKQRIFYQDNEVTIDGKDYEIADEWLDYDSNIFLLAKPLDRTKYVVAVNGEPGLIYDFSKPVEGHKKMESDYREIMPRTSSARGKEVTPVQKQALERRIRAITTEMSARNGTAAGKIRNPLFSGRESYGLQMELERLEKIRDTGKMMKADDVTDLNCTGKMKDGDKKKKRHRGR